MPIYYLIKYVMFGVCTVAVLTTAAARVTRKSAASDVTLATAAATRVAAQANNSVICQVITFILPQGNKTANV